MISKSVQIQNEEEKLLHEKKIYSILSDIKKLTPILEESISVDSELGVAKNTLNIL